MKLNLFLRITRFFFSDLFQISLFLIVLTHYVLTYFHITPEIPNDTLFNQIVNSLFLIPIIIIGWKLFRKNRLLKLKIPTIVQFLILSGIIGLFAVKSIYVAESNPLSGFLISIFMMVTISLSLKLIVWTTKYIFLYPTLLKKAMGYKGEDSFGDKLYGFLKVVFVLAALLGFYQVYVLSNRLAVVESHLGGTAKLACNEKESIAKVRQSVVRVVGGWSEGSGFAVKDGDMVITNFHVIEFEPSPKIIMPDNTFKTAQIVLTDKAADIAILKIDSKLPVTAWGESSWIEPGDELLAVGFPFGGDLVGESTVNKGFLAGKRTDRTTGVDYLQTDATLNPGVSGGPMINICGEIVGMNTMGTAGLGLAITSGTIRKKWIDMAFSSEPLKDVKVIVFQPEKGAGFAVEAFYNYIKIRKMEDAFALLSDNYKGGFKIENWKRGYESNLDTSLVSIKDNPEKENFIMVKLTTKDLIGDEIIIKYFEGEWEVRQVDGKWLLWDPEIKEVTDPGYGWFY